MKRVQTLPWGTLFVAALIMSVLPCPSFCQSGRAPTLILIRPQEKQIENLLVLKNEALLDADLAVIAVYHQDELTDYEPAREYVRKHKLDWVHFRTISGGIHLKAESPARGINQWTSQFMKLFHDSDGIIFTGGMDLPPRLYGEETRLTTEVTTPIRSVYEFSFLHHLIGDGSPADADSPIPFLRNRPNYTILCICLGCQTLNAAAGGTLIQNIPSQLYGLNSYEAVLEQPSDQIHSGRYLSGLNHHLAHELPPAMHRIRGNGLGRITPSLLSAKNKTPLILSSHHQALGRIGRGILVTASSMDGKVSEMVEHEDFPAVLGVQFHPESASLYRRDIMYRRVGTFSKSSHHAVLEKAAKREWMNRGPISPDKELNLRQSLESSDSFAFHRQLWQWFSNALRLSSKKTE